MSAVCLCYHCLKQLLMHTFFRNYLVELLTRLHIARICVNHAGFFSRKLRQHRVAQEQMPLFESTLRKNTVIFHLNNFLKGLLYVLMICVGEFIQFQRFSFALHIRKCEKIA